MKGITMKAVISLFTFVLACAAFPPPAHAMHIADGILPMQWAALWYLLAIPAVAMGLRTYRRESERSPRFRPLAGLVGAAVFVISCMPIPVPFTGTCSHPTGTGLAAILLGPWLTAAISSIALLLQALFLAHGGLTTLGGNIVSMGIAGAFSGYAVFRAARWAGLSLFASAFLAGVISDWATYATTSAELALALHGDGSVSSLFLAILTAFVPTQLPLGIMEGFVTAYALRFLSERWVDFPFARDARKERSKAVPIVLAVFLALAALSTAASAGGYVGVDEAVVEKVAAENGRKASPPLVDVEGDMGLFLFLIAGAAGGFACGYFYRSLSIKKEEKALTDV
ncbi:MAG: energy-coupling factor ABC transporter permease [Nitrospinae bacterium]|nr:energy-coupling factor ABC transporter permease [Nitrospinota bacterium]